MKKKFWCAFLSIFVIVLLYFSTSLLFYLNRQNENVGMLDFCSQTDSEECYTRMFEMLLPKILIHNVWIDGVEIDLVKLDKTSRVDSANALHIASNLIGYGVYRDTHYEEEYSRLFNAYSYAFDCGVKNFVPEDKLCKFSSECVGSDDFLIMDQVSSGKIHTLENKLKELGLLDKKVFIKMDVAEADVVVLPEIIKNADKITGINVALHIRSPKAILDRLSLLDSLNEKFVLVARNTPFFDENDVSEIINSKYYKGTLNDRVLYLSYVNKDIIDKSELLFLQNTDKYYKKKNVARLFYTTQIPLSDISLYVTVNEKLKNFFKLGKTEK